MPNRFIIPLLLAATVAFARGSTTRSGPTARTTNHINSNSALLTSSFEVSVAKPVRLALSVTNLTNKMIELRFPSGMTHDFFVYDATGKEVWRWSSGKMFTQGMQNKLLKSRGTALYEHDWNPAGKRGEFTAIAILRSDNHPVESRVTFTLP